MNGDSFDAVLSSLRRRIVTLGFLSATAWSIATALLVLFTFALFDLVSDFSPAARIVAIAAALAAGIAAFLKTRTRTTASARQRQIAMRLDNCLRAGGEVLTGYELSTSS